MNAVTSAPATATTTSSATYAPATASGVVFDIETCLNLDAVTMPAFDLDTIKLGNVKDPAKIEARIAEARANHETNWRKSAALSPVDGRVIAIACLRAEPGQAVRFTFAETAADEPKLIEDFWRAASRIVNDGRKLIGVGISGFDLPFLIRRSWILGLDVPASIRDGRYWNRSFVDLQDLWLAGLRFGSESCAFGELARAFGTPGKLDGLDGSQFADLFLSGNPDDRAKAIEYLRQDVEQPAVWARRMGVVV